MKRKQDFILQNLGGEFILVPLGAEVVNLNGIILFNNTGKFLWEQLSEERTENELISAIMEKFDVDYDRAKADLEVFLNDITQKGLLVS